MFFGTKQAVIRAYRQASILTMSASYCKNVWETLTELSYCVLSTFLYGFLAAPTSALCLF